MPVLSLAKVHPLRFHSMRTKHPPLKSRVPALQACPVAPLRQWRGAHCPGDQSPFHTPHIYRETTGPWTFSLGNKGTQAPLACVPKA